MALLVLTFSLVLTRVGAFVAVLPLFGGVLVPRFVKVGLTVALTSLWFGASVANLSPELLEKPLDTSWVALGLATAREAILGALLGYIFALFQVPARVAGEFLTQELGLSFGAFLNPTGEGNVSGLTQILDILGILLFLGMDGHHVFLAILDSTFARFPVGAGWPGAPIGPLVDGAAITVEWGVALAAPMVLVLFVVTFVLTLMARAAPQINLFSVGFPLRLTAGLVIVFLLLPNFLVHLMGVLGRWGELIRRMI